MSETPATEPPADPFQQLPKAVYRTIIADLYADIPPPHLTDPELIAERVHAAIAEIASMCPVNAEEARTSASPPPTPRPGTASATPARSPTTPSPP